LLSNKALNIPITTSINISKRGLGALKKKKRKRKIKETGQMSQHREISSIPSSPQILQSKERYKFLQGAKVELGIRHYHFFTPFIFTHHHRYLSLSPYIHSTHISRTTHMHILI
jgi:hypothetical protein